MERLTDEQLSEIRKRAEAATPGPWYWEKLDTDSWDDTEMPSLLSANDEGVMHFGDCETYYPTEGSPPNDNDAEFIAHARQDVPKLLAEIERLRADQGLLIAEIKKADIFSEELERKYYAAKWPEVEASMKKYAAKIRRERDGSDI